MVVEGKVLALDRSEVWFLTPLLAGWEYLGKLGNGWKIALWASQCLLRYLVVLGTKTSREV